MSSIKFGIFLFTPFLIGRFHLFYLLYGGFYDTRSVFSHFIVVISVCSSHDLWFSRSNSWGRVGAAFPRQLTYPRLLAFQLWSRPFPRRPALKGSTLFHSVFVCLCLQYKRVSCLSLRNEQATQTPETWPRVFGGALFSSLPSLRSLFQQPISQS